MTIPSTAPSADVIRKRCDRAVAGIETFRRAYRDAEALASWPGTGPNGSETKQPVWESNPTQAAALDPGRSHLRHEMYEAAVLLRLGAEFQRMALERLQKADRMRRESVGSKDVMEWTQERAQTQEERSMRERESRRGRKRRAS